MPRDTQKVSTESSKSAAQRAKDQADYDFLAERIEVVCLPSSDPERAKEVEDALIELGMALWLAKQEEKKVALSKKAVKAP